MAKDLVFCFESFQIPHVPREANTEADRLARIGSGQEIDPLCPVVILSQSSIDRASVNLVEEAETWMTSIIRYLIAGELPIDKNEARKLRRRSAHYAYKYEQLYKKGYSVPLLKCITPERGLYVMQEIHKGICGNHSGPRSLFHKIILNIIFHFGIPHSLVSDNGTQFDSAGLKKLCSDLGIHKHFSSVAHPQSNGQVEAVNKTIKNNLEQKLNGAKGLGLMNFPEYFGHIALLAEHLQTKLPFL
ncbi:hypothetical protein UlMin_000434 [Ulmus minor]